MLEVPHLNLCPAVCLTFVRERGELQNVVVCTECLERPICQAELLIMPDGVWNAEHLVEAFESPENVC